ncbi:hypothetical protein CDD83_2985 [Cordyceps sp. RAO-2017]|nr:hypothetical protein CDD83_2985 [Cordyceps sp. RAO-2017]
MGKGSDKLYITHSEWSSSDTYSASVGANTSARTGGPRAPFRRLPFNFCAASLQPFENPVCTPGGTIFDIEVISAWLEKHPDQNPVDGGPLQQEDLIRLNFARNIDPSSSDPSSRDSRGELIDPVTFKVLTDNTHIVAIRHGTYANVFAWETVERMNVKTKIWQDLVDDHPFSRADIITLQDPKNSLSRNLNQFKYLQDGHEAEPTKAQRETRQASTVNAGALGNIGHKISKARATVEKARKAQETGTDVNRSAVAVVKPNSAAAVRALRVQETKSVPNAATYTTGKAAASFTSTGLTPETSGERALLTDEEYMLKPRRVKAKGYARMDTNMGELTIELHTEMAPKAVWNFIKLAQKGYYEGVAFHRNIPGFMIQGGDPSGTGKGGCSIWGKNFNDEFEGSQTHDARGIVSMANKGKNTNSSQFFITYKPTPHLDRKHTIFGRLAGGGDVLDEMEVDPTDGCDRPLDKIFIKKVVVLIDPFEEFLKQRFEEQRLEEQREEVRRQGGTDDDKTTWTGKRIRGDGSAKAAERRTTVGKYLTATVNAGADDHGVEGASDIETWEEPVKKKFRGNRFGNFDNW